MIPSFFVYYLAEVRLDPSASVGMMVVGFFFSVISLQQARLLHHHTERQSRYPAEPAHSGKSYITFNS